jgi:hypothetical protein
MRPLEWRAHQAVRWSILGLPEGARRAIWLAADATGSIGPRYPEAAEPQFLISAYRPLTVASPSQRSSPESDRKLLILFVQEGTELQF